MYSVTCRSQAFSDVFFLYPVIVCVLSITFGIMQFSRYIPSSRFLFRLPAYQVITSLPDGDNEIRTRDPLLARQVLSQLSYTPINLAATYSPMPSPA